MMETFEVYHHEFLPMSSRIYEQTNSYPCYIENGSKTMLATRECIKLLMSLLKFVKHFEEGKLEKSPFLSLITSTYSCSILLITRVGTSFSIIIQAIFCQISLGFVTLRINVSISLHQSSLVYCNIDN